MLGSAIQLWVYKVLGFLQFYSKGTWGRDMPWETGNQSTYMSFFLPEEPNQLHKLAFSGERTIFSIFVEQTVV